MNKLHLSCFLNIFSLTFLTCIRHRGNEVGTHNIYLCMNFFNGNTWKVRNDRLLTNDILKSERGQTDPSNNVTLPGGKNTLKDITGSSENYEKVKKNISNSMHAYIKKLEHEYPNKRGLKRLDCHYEKKLFNERYKLDNIAGHIKSKNFYFKKVILKRYGLRFFIFSLVILFGIVTSLWCQLGGEKEDNIKCLISNISNPTPEKGSCSICKVIQNVILGSNSIIYFPLVIAFLSFIIYTTSKIRKYKRLKNIYAAV